MISTKARMVDVVNVAYVYADGKETRERNVWASNLPSSKIETRLAGNEQRGKEKVINHTLRVRLQMSKRISV